MKKFYIALILQAVACLGMDTQTPPNRPNNISPLAAQLIAQGVKPVRIRQCGDVDFTNGIAITKEGEMWHHSFILGLGFVYAGLVEGAERLKILESLQQQ